MYLKTDKTRFYHVNTHVACISDLDRVSEIKFKKITTFGVPQMDLLVFYCVLRGIFTAGGAFTHEKQKLYQVNGPVSREGFG